LALLAGKILEAEDQAYLGRIDSAVLLRVTPNVLQLTRGNGTTAVYTRRVKPRLVRVKKSQTNKRLQAAKKKLRAEFLAAALPPAPRKEEVEGVAEPPPLVAPSAEQQVGLLEVAELSQRGFAQILGISRGARLGMAGVAELRGDHEWMQALRSKKVSVNTAGAYSANFSLAVEEPVSSLCGSKRFIERDIFDNHSILVPKTTLFTDAASRNLSVLSGGRPPEMKVVHITIGSGQGRQPALGQSFCRDH